MNPLFRPPDLSKPLESPPAPSVDGWRRLVSDLRAALKAERFDGVVQLIEERVAKLP
jgi:hypothetical protein